MKGLTLLVLVAGWLPGAWAAPPSRVEAFVKLKPGLPESAVIESLGAPSGRKSVSGREILTFEGPAELRLQLEGGKLKAGMIELVDSLDPSELFSGDAPAIEVEGVTLSETPDLRIKRRYLDLPQQGIRIELYRGRSSRMWLIPPEAEKPQNIKAGPLRHWLVKTPRRSQ